MNRLITLLLMVLAIGNATAATVTNQITCDLPTERMDGSALAPDEIVKVTAYVTRCDGSKATLTADNCLLTDTFTLPGTRCTSSYALTATDSEGLESDHAEPVTVDNELAKPRSPTTITIIIMQR